MPDELEALLRLVADGRLTPEEAAPLVERLQAAPRAGAGRASAEPARADGKGEEADSWRSAGPHDRHRDRAEHRKHDVRGDRPRRPTILTGSLAFRGSNSAEGVLANRRLKILVVEHGRDIVNLQMPLAAAGYAIDRIPGLSAENRIRIVEAIRSGMTGPIIQARDDDDEVRIVIE